MDLTFAVSPWQWWLLGAILLFVLEIFTPGFVLACFGVASLLGMFAALLGLGVLWQVIAFCIGALLSLVFIRPFVRRISQKKKGTNTGADALIGRCVKVTERINSTESTGRVAVDGDSWKANSIDGSTIEVGTDVKIVGRESIILYVESCPSV
ncbi:hypothetical protein HQ45_08665 [Porphyromonas crevioricanis]|uniref:NfeD-like C-terminal, partner-binding n=2 Tax=Porphyromonas crevioricanis TaxID=393921 RepID=A0A0A2G275_9PORP|nr:NfeD family protein [Porphyromonas crevioricanis]KGN88757.1 hypothetical protein HQ45_08665 [Porphyromonas crevioricanis]KGN96450.1 hypothetical protein HQ38_01315 [Porphyromonas crevioricanis]SJZ94682.1 Membrane protein implicated in regulation of membrane protease activity [Porphyromonas crevioricanis]SQH73626.1 NfeD-like C-terminal, partner-binding [Porphyromonas crevioricanis]GAD05464.1 hypothetical protein PORCRE_1166 [Porphyromonas crevioricanis JCM 15906]